jgi:hypothetical protein
MPSQKQRFSDTTPAPPAGNTNVTWQADPPGPVGTIRHISAYVPTGGGGSGNLSGTLTVGKYPIATAAHTLGDGTIDYGLSFPNTVTVSSAGSGGLFLADIGMGGGGVACLTDGTVSFIAGGAAGSIAFSNYGTGGIQLGAFGGGGISLTGNTSVAGTLATTGRIKGLNIQTASYATVATDEIIQMNAAGATTVTLANSVAAVGQVYSIKNVGAGTCTIQPSSGNIDSHASIALTQWQGIEVYWDGTLWHILSESLAP